MKFRWLNNIQSFTSNILSVANLAWQARPAHVAGIVLLNVVQGLLPVATAWLMKLTFDLLTLYTQDRARGHIPQDLLFLLVAQAVLVVMHQTIGLVRGYLNSELGWKLALNAQSTIYKKINSFVGLAYFENSKFYDTIRVASGAQRSPLQAVNALTSLLQSVVTLISFLSILITFSPVLAGVVGLSTLPHVYLQIKMRHQQLDLIYQNSPRERLAAYYGSVLSEIHFAKEVRLFGLVDYFMNFFLHLYQQIHRAQRCQYQRELRWQLFLHTLSSLVASGAFVAVVIQAFSGRLSLGDVTLYTNAVGNVQGGLTSIIFALSGLSECVMFYSRFRDLLALPQPVSVANPVCPVPQLKSGIELRNVGFRYAEGRPWVLRNVSLFVPAGKCLALVGANGAGKTTLAKLLVRFYDATEGQILWDGIDIREFEPGELRYRIGAIFQDFIRYSLTARENIGLGDIKNIDDMTLVRQAAMDARVHEMIEALPHGYQTILSRWLVDNGSGVDLSGGEWQKIAIARMFMRDADILILDEPTASLDPVGEYEIYSHFVNLRANSTSLLISHRFSTVRIADIVAVLDNGQITEYGSHDELVSLGGTYMKLYNMQADRYR